MNVLCATGLLWAAPALVVAGAAAPVSQQRAPQSGSGDAAPPVEELVAAALDRAPTLIALRARLAAAREMVRPAGALPDPMVELMWQDIAFPRWTVGTQEMSMIGPELRQEIPYPGKRAARRDAALAETGTRAAELEQLRREVARRVRAAYARVWALDRERDLLSAGREMLDMLSATAASRYSVGETDEEAVLKAQLELARLGERLDDVAAERSSEVAALNRLLDRAGAAPFGEVRELPTPTLPAPPWEDAATQASPEVAVRRAAIATLEKRVAAARLDVKPDFTTGAALGLRGGFDPSVTLRFGLSLPLWRKEKQEPAVRAAEAELAAAQADLRAAEASARSVAAGLAADWTRAGRQIERYRQAIVPQSSAAVDAARAAYLVGRGDFLTVVDDFNRWLDARIGLARREAERFAAWAEVEALIPSPAGEGSQKEN